MADDGLKQFHEAWESIRIVRNVSYSLFTFGDSDLPYYLICEPAPDQTKVAIRQGTVRVTRPMIVRPENAPPTLLNFFDEEREAAAAEFLFARTAAFSNMTFDNVVGSERFVSDDMDEAVARVAKQLDREEEDRVALLAAPHHLGGVAVFRYTVERILASAPDNLQELRERGFLP